MKMQLPDRQVDPAELLDCPTWWLPGWLTDTTTVWSGSAQDGPACWVKLTGQQIEDAIPDDRLDESGWAFELHGQHVYGCSADRACILNRTERSR